MEVFFATVCRHRTGMPLTLHYLPLRARAEPLKMILRHCGVTFVDRHVPFAEWGEWKASGKVPPGRTGNVQLPVLELEDGTLMPESIDIAKHVWTVIAGKKVMGSDPDLLWALNDTRDAPFNSPDFILAGMVNPLLNWFPEEDAAPKIAPLVAGFPAFFAHVTPCLGEGPFFGGSEPNYGDFQIFHIVDNLCTLDGGATMTALESTQPALAMWHKAMLQLPAVAAHLAARPQPGSGEVGRSGSIIAKHKVPHARA